jgi:hypothetical protein
VSEVCAYDCRPANPVAVARRRGGAGLRDACIITDAQCAACSAQADA